MTENTVVDVSGKSQEAIRQLQIQKIITYVEQNEFIYNSKHEDFHKRGKRSLFWVETTTNLNKAFPNDKLHRKYFIWFHKMKKYCSAIL